MPIRLSRTVRFYGLVAKNRNTSEESPIELIDWGELLRQYGTLDYGVRQVDLRGDTYVFAPGQEGARLAVHRKKHAGEFLNVINESTGEIEQIKAADGDRSYADSSMVVFIKDRPVFALSGGGGNGSPRAARVADWLTGEVLVNGGDVFFDVVPLSTEPDLGSMVGADGARKVRFKVPAGSLRDEPDAGVVSRAFREIQNHLVDGYVEITLSVGRRKVTDKDRDTMLQFAQDLSDELVEGAAGEVGIVREVQGAKKNSVKLQSEMIDLVKHNIAEKFDLPVGSDELMIDLTFGNIERIIEKQQKLVDKALEAMGLTNGSLGAGG